MWWVAAPIQFLFALTVCTRWVVHPRSIQLMTPQMFIPVVGLSLVPIAGAGLGFAEIGERKRHHLLVFDFFFFKRMVVFWSCPGVLDCIVWSANASTVLFRFSSC